MWAGGGPPIPWAILLALAGVARGAPGDASATRVADINPGPLSSSVSNLTNVGGTLYFTASDGTNGLELWKATIEGPGPPTNPIIDPIQPPKKCKKGRKLKKGKCVKKRRRKPRR